MPELRSEGARLRLCRSYRPSVPRPGPARGGRGGCRPCRPGGGRAVGGDDQLSAAVVQGGEDVEEFRLGGFGVRQELDIVDEQHAGVQVTAAEAVLSAAPGRDRELAA